MSLSALPLAALWPASLGAVLQRSLDASLDAPAEVAERRRVDFAIRAVREETDYTLVEGIAYPALDVPESGEVPGEDAFRIDSYRTWMSPETLRAFAYKFLERGTGGIDSHHDHGTVGSIVESWITREASEQYPTLVWVVTVKVLKETTRQELRDGKLKGFSIEFTGKYREKVLTVTGVGKVRTGEIIDPYPLTLSLVKAPAIGIFFADVEERSAREDSGGVTPLWRSDMTIKTEPQAAVQTPSEPAAAPPAVPPTEAREAPPQTPPAEPAKPVTVEALRANFVALLGGFRSAQDLGKEEVEAFVRQVESRASTDWSSLASVWGACANRWKVRDAMNRALMAAESVFYECAYYGNPSDEEMVKKFRALGTDFNAVVAGICDEADAAMGVSTRSAAPTEGDGGEAHTRAGKKISKATRDTLEKAKQCANDCCGHLDGLLGEETEESETESETKSARELAEARAALDAARANLATRETELTAARDEGATLRARAEKAEKRVEALESARPAPRSDDPPAEAQNEKREPKSPLQGVLGLSRFVGRGADKPAVDAAKGDDDGEE